MKQVAPISFIKRSAIGVNDANLRNAMAAADRGIIAHTVQAMTHPYFEQWRNIGAQLKDASLANLDILLERFEKNAQAAGAKVHWASDGLTARRIAADIMRLHSHDDAIKSKSMLCEEIELNHGLEQADVKVLETDLGEYIVQLSQGRPSHIIAPIIHMTRDQVIEIFAEHHGEYDRSSNEKIVAEAREQLRERMINAKVGITGANFLIADTGSVVLVTNEGNGRYCSSALDVRITLAGIEKVVPSLHELATLLRLLPRAGTGQTSSSYVSFGTGAAGKDKPKHHHIILIDNGRSRMLTGKYRKMLRCIRCGSCMNHCPVYKLAGGLSYASTYVGPMGAVLSPNLFGAGHEELPHATTMCGACSVACPVKIPLPDLMRHLREDQVTAGKESLRGRLAFSTWAFFARHPQIYSLLTQLASWTLRTLGGKDHLIHKLPGAAAWFDMRDLPVPHQAPFRTTLDHHEHR